MTPLTTPSQASFLHPALFYGTDQEYLAALVPFVLHGLDAGDPVAVALPPWRLELLGSALGPKADQVTMIDMTEAGRNPGRIIASVLRRFADRHHDRRVHIVGEPIWAGRTALEYPACVQHEALINHAFADRDVTIVCPYDTSSLDTQVILDARATHPVIWQADLRHPSDHYAPDTILDRYNQILDQAQDVEKLSVRRAADLPTVRRAATDYGRLHGLAPQRMADLELIVAELVSNSLIHTDTGCELRLWCTADSLICEVHDHGSWNDPLAGRRPAPAGQVGGRGLLLVNDLADLVRIHTSRHSTTVRVTLNLEQH